MIGKRMVEKLSSEFRNRTPTRTPADGRRLIARRGWQRGQGLVELSFVLIAMMLLLAGAADLGRMYFIHLTLRDAAQEGASYGSTDPTNGTAIENHVKDAVGATIDPTSLTVSSGPTVVGFYCAGIVPTTMEANSIRVNVQYNMPIAVPFIGAIVGSNSLPMSVTVENTILYPQCP